MTTFVILTVLFGAVPQARALGLEQAWSQISAAQTAPQPPAMDLKEKVAALGRLTAMHRALTNLESRLKQFDDPTPRLGMEFAPNGEPAKVARVRRSSPAALAGIRAGDMITRIGGKSALSMNAAELAELIARSNPVELQLGRMGVGLIGASLSKQDLSLNAADLAQLRGHASQLSDQIEPLARYMTQGKISTRQFDVELLSWWKEYSQTEDALDQLAYEPLP